MTEDLEELLAAAAGDPGFTAEAVLALWESEVWVLGEVEQQRVRITRLDGPDGPFVPFFTSELMVRHTLDQVDGLDAHYLVLPTPELWRATAGELLVLNPHGPLGRIFTADDISRFIELMDAGARRRRRRR